MRFPRQPSLCRMAVQSRTDLGHPSTKGLPAACEPTDEWYNFRSSRRGAAHILATLGESTYSGGHAR